MTVRFGPIASRCLALGILAALVTAGYLAIALPLLDTVADNRREIADLNAALARFEQIAGERAARKAELGVLERQQATQEGFLQGSNETLIAADLQNRIKALAAAGKGELTSTQILASDAEGKLKRVGVRGLMAIPLAGLVRVFYDLESATPFLFIDNVEIRPRLDPRRRGYGDVDTGTLEARFDVYGFVHAAALPALPSVTPRRR
ncbi:MAG TPA: type II secretion system protein GspM [Stellaceae bacterium]|nr:type II secretion system protein GspM [Stellaceae bacterium]